MENFGLNSAKSYIGKNVNLHLKDGSVIINVHLTGIQKGISGKSKFLKYAHSGNLSTAIPLRNVAWAENLNMNFIQLFG